MRPPNIPPQPVGRYRPWTGSCYTTQHRAPCRPGDQSASGRFHRLITSPLKILVVPVLVLVTAGFFAPTQSVSSGTAHEFLSNYFSEVVQANQRQALYFDDLTPSFRSSSSWVSFDAFWETQKSVTVVAAVPVPQSALEFQVNLIFHPLNGGVIEETYNFWFGCKGFFGILRSRVPSLGCPLKDLEIDNQQLASGGAPA